MGWRIVSYSILRRGGIDRLVPVIQKKADWALKYITPDLVSIVPLASLSRAYISHSAHA